MNKAQVSVKQAIWGDAELLAIAQSFIRDLGNKDEAARAMVGYLHAMETFITPDGVKYTRNGVRYAMIGMESSKVKTDAQEQVIEAVVSRLKAYANEQYSKGWDVIVECWSTPEFVESIATVSTSANNLDVDKLFDAAKANVQEFVDLYGEQESNTRFE